MDPKTLEKLIDNGRDGYEARLAAGQARLAAGDVEPAITHLAHATEFKPDATTGWQELGKARRDAGQFGAARVAWQRGIEVADANGDKQAGKVMRVWLKRLG